MEAEARLDNQSPELFGQTPPQTVGPFFHYGLPWKGGADLVERSDLGARPDLFPEEHYVMSRSSVVGAPDGERIEIAGRVLDAEGAPVPDAMVEIWQANAAGRYTSMADAQGNVALDANFLGFGRASTGDDGEFRFRTIRPGRVPGPGGVLQASHIAISVFGRGILKRLATRLYFQDGEGNEADPVLSLVLEERRPTLLAVAEEPAVWRFDIRLGGERETVFFAL